APLYEVARPAPRRVVKPQGEAERPMTIKLLLALAAVAAGVAATVQGAANAALSPRAGRGAAPLLNTGIVLVGALVFFLVSGARATFFPADTPWSLYVGGLRGVRVLPPSRC